MKIISTGDFHFNAGYDEDVLASVNQIIEYVSQNLIDLIAITGDVYDKASDPGSRNLAAECIQKLSDKAEVLVVRGNHDAPGDLAILSKLESCCNITVCETPTMVIDKGVMIHTLPWLTKARWQAMHPEATKEEGDKTVSQLVLDFLKNNIVLNPGYKHILVGHLTVAGARAQLHQQMGADGITVGLYDLTEAGFYAALLGHIHLRQDVGSPRHFYNGSIAALDYGEDPNKYFSVLDTNTGDVEWVKLNTIHRQDVNANWSPNGIIIDLNGATPAMMLGARIRANLRIEGGDNIEQAKSQLEDYLKKSGALEYKINPQVITISQVRAVEISKAEKLSDKLYQYWIATKIPDEATQADMLTKLSEIQEHI